MGLAAFNRMRREAEEKAAQESDQSTETPKSPNNDLTAPQIKEKLGVLNIEFAKSAKKDELLVLLDEAEAAVNKPKEGDQSQDDQDQDDNQTQTSDESSQSE